MKLTLACLFALVAIAHGAACSKKDGSAAVTADCTCATDSATAFKCAVKGGGTNAGCATQKDSATCLAASAGTCAKAGGTNANCAGKTTKATCEAESIGTCAATNDTCNKACAAATTRKACTAASTKTAACVFTDGAAKCVFSAVANNACIVTAAITSCDVKKGGKCTESAGKSAKCEKAPAAKTTGCSTTDGKAGVTADCDCDATKNTKACKKGWKCTIKALVKNTCTVKATKKNDNCAAAIASKAACDAVAIGTCAVKATKKNGNCAAATTPGACAAAAIGTCAAKADCTNKNCAAATSAGACTLAGKNCVFTETNGCDFTETNGCDYKAGSAASNSCPDPNAKKSGSAGAALSFAAAVVAAAFAM